MYKRFFFSMLILISGQAFAQYKVRFIVQEATTQKHDSIYITGSFNNWNPNDSNDLLKPTNATQKTFALSLTAGTYQLNFTRGDWSKSEKNGACADPHRILTIDRDTTIHILIKNWGDDCSVNLFSGDKWYQLRTDSVAASAEIILSMVILIYLLSIKKKSRDGWLITRYMILMTIFYLINFLRNINETPWRIDLVQDVATGWLTIYHVWFSYNYRKKNYRVEMRIVLSLLIILINTALLFEIVSPFWKVSLPSISPVLFSSFTLAYLWSISVLLRKAALTSYTTEPDKIKLSGRDGKAFRSFALWSALFVVSYLNYLMLIFGVRLSYNPFLVFHAISLISLTWFAINYVNYAEEYTTFQVKLVGIMLCITLLLLGLLGFIILPDGYISQTAEGRPVQDAVNILTMLVPVMTVIIVLVFPVFLRKNLLRPLKEVLDGVQRVNEGDLKVEVPVEVKDEIGFLSHNFNQMTRSLRQYAENMESLVSERTTQLEKQKEELQTTLQNLKSTQAQLIQSEKMASLGELTAGIAHEIQNPLNFVNNFSEVNMELLTEMKDEINKGNIDEVKLIADDIMENEEKINHHGKRADAIVKGMLQHSRTSSSQKEPTDINALADEYLRLSYHGLRAKDKTFNATLQTDFDKSIGKINIIPQDIGRVLLNLYNNAFYAVTEKKKQQPQDYEPIVSVSTKKINDKVEIRVKDNGNGISQKVIDKIFQPFFTTKPTGQGTGLGLSLSYDIVKAHGGEIKVVSMEGEGTTFEIDLPG